MGHHLAARWVFPVGSSPIENGAIEVVGDRIAHFGTRRVDSAVRQIAIIPGLVNAHSHLDLSHAASLIPPGRDFTAWLRKVIALRRSSSRETTEAGIIKGAQECLAHGVTLVGDIASAGQSWESLAKLPLRAVVYHELVGLSQERAESSLATALDWLHSHPSISKLRPGLSPHAPYSVRASLFAQVGQICESEGLPAAVHLAETKAELELLAAGTGVFVDFLRDLGIWDPHALISSCSQVLELLDESHSLAIAHGNYLPKLPKPGSNTTVVYCPRTHAAFGHDPYPLEALLVAGSVALGTDSLASNPDLSLLAEARLTRKLFPWLPGRSLLEMITCNGAQALGWPELGRIAPGCPADLVVLRLPERSWADPHEAIWDEDTRIERVMIAGDWVFTRPATES